MYSLTGKHKTGQPSKYEQYVARLREKGINLDNSKIISFITSLTHYLKTQLEQSQDLLPFIPAIELQHIIYHANTHFAKSPFLSAVWCNDYCEIVLKLIEKNQDTVECYSNLKILKFNFLTLDAIFSILKAMIAKGRPLHDPRIKQWVNFLKTKELKPILSEQELTEEQCRLLADNFGQDKDLIAAILSMLGPKNKEIYTQQTNPSKIRLEKESALPDITISPEKKDSDESSSSKDCVPIPFIFHKLLDEEALTLYEEFYAAYCKEAKNKSSAEQKTEFHSFILKHFFEFAYLINFLGNQQAFAFFNYLLQESSTNLIRFFEQYKIAKSDYPDSVWAEISQNFDKLKYFLMVSHHFEKDGDLMLNKDFLPFLNAYFSEENSQRSAENFAHFFKTYYQKSQQVLFNLQELFGEELGNIFYNELKNSIFEFEIFLKDYEPLSFQYTTYLSSYINSPLQVSSLKTVLQTHSLLQIIKIYSPDENLIEQFSHFLLSYYGNGEHQESLREIIKEHSSALIALMDEKKLGKETFTLLAKAVSNPNFNLKKFLTVYSAIRTEDLVFLIDNFHKFIAYASDPKKMGELLLDLFANSNFDTNKDEAINSDALLELTRHMIFYPEHFKELTAYFSRLYSLNIHAWASAHENWSLFAFRVLMHAEPMLSEEDSQKSQELLRLWENSKKVDTASLETIDMENLANDYQFVRLLNRSIILERKTDSAVSPDKKVYLIFKVRKKNEDVFELHKQNDAVQFLRENTEELTLKSIFPIPNGVVKITNLGAFVDGLSQKEKLSEKELKDFKNTVGENEKGEYEAYCCEALEGDFTYIHEPKLSAEEVVTGLKRFIWDAVKMLEIGIVYYQPIDLSHDRDQTRGDQGVYHPTVNLTRMQKAGGGRVNDWEGGVKYPNFGPHGGRDQGDCCHIHKFFNRGNQWERHLFEELHNTSYGKKAYAKNYILAHFLANFIVSIDLLIDKWVLQQHRNHPHLSSKEVEKLWQVGVAMKQELYVFMYMTLSHLPEDVVYRHVHGIDKKEGERVTEGIYDKDQDKRQAMYWLYPEEYVDDIPNNTVRPGVYAENTRVVVNFKRFEENTFRTRKDVAEGKAKQLGFSLDGVSLDRGPDSGQDPHKEAEKTRYHLITFSFAARQSTEKSKKLCQEAFAALEQGDYKNAREHYQKAIDLNPYNVNARKGLLEATTKMETSSNSPEHKAMVEKDQRNYAGSVIKRNYREWQEHKRQENQNEEFVKFSIKK